MVSRKPVSGGEAGPEHSPDHRPSSVEMDQDARTAYTADGLPNVRSINRKDVPASLLAGGGQLPAKAKPVTQPQDHSSGSSDMDRIPTILKSADDRSETNPFVRRKPTPVADNETPTAPLSQLNLSQDNGNQWISQQQQEQPSMGLLRHETGTSLAGDGNLLPAQGSLSSTNPWAASASATPSPAPPTSTAPPAPQQPAPPIPSMPLISVASDDEDQAWHPVSGKSPQLPQIPDVSSEWAEEQRTWQDVGQLQGQGDPKGFTDAPALERSDSDDWNMVDSDVDSEEEAESKPSKEPSSDLIPVHSEGKSNAVPAESQPKDPATGKSTMKPSEEVALLVSGNSAETQQIPTTTTQVTSPQEDEPPTPPPRPVSMSPAPSRQVSPTGEDSVPPLPPRESPSQRWTSTRAPVDGATETYHIKNITWQDSESTGEVRTSPILVQNANGPCPLVALVNALTLTTPENAAEAPLVQVLRTREQVSLNLLLDAVFDELMSPRRMGEDTSLPDMSDLYSFLQSLHTGMNVNPRFIPAPEVLNAYKKSTLTHLEPSQREDCMPGTFENTGEMGLYATFSIPLIHGWLPRRTESVYASLERQAGSYEDAQNLLFCEDELENKLTTDAGLTAQEQELYQDILTIRDFLFSSATQLTTWGIEVIGKAMRPGTFAILFRNDHFSTLYSHPQSKQLMTLVTDAGYKTHDEIVWESLSDVNGIESQFLSGDFRPVGPGDGARVGQERGSGGSQHEGHVATPSGQQNAGITGGNSSAPPPDQTDFSGSSREQEDRDLALALQLQEEEDRQHHEQERRRARESELSTQFIEQQGHTSPTTGGNRGGRNSVAAGRNSNANSLVPNRRASSSVTGGGGGNSGNSGTAQARAVSDSQYRPTIPPRRAGVAAAAPVGSGEEAPPPTYEEAQTGLAYEPPPGHPAHESTSTSLAQQASRNSSSTGGGAAAAAAGRGRGQSRGAYYGRPHGMGPGMSVASYGTASQGSMSSRDRDCVVM